MRRRSVLCWFSIALFLCAVRQGICSIKADVRCYCNLPACVTSGYMCKSSAGICVSELSTGDIWRWRHACAELIFKDNHQRAALNCRENSTRWCCSEDMCNYLGSVVASQTNRMNHSYMTGYLSNHDTSLLRGGSDNAPRSWFRAAVVAVPVAGGCVLIVLIVMATRMLRQDREIPPSLKPMDTTVVYAKDKSYFLPKSLSCALLGRCQTPVIRSYASMGSIRHPNSLYRSVSLALSTDSASTDSSRDKYFVFDV